MALALADSGLVCVPPSAFIETDLRHTKDRWAGQRFGLRDWQREILDELYRRERGERVYTEALIGMPRKNGKSELGAALALHGLVADGTYAGECYSAAGDKDQARVVFGTAKRMVEFSFRLSRSLKIWRDVIEDPGTDSIYRVLSADAPLKHGLNPSLVVFDEVWNQPSTDLYEALTTGSGTREYSLVIMLTTAGFDQRSLLWYLYQRGLKGRDPRFYFRWFGLPQGSRSDYRKPETWAAANPALGDFLREDFLADMCRRLPENVFRRLHLNQWTSSETTWITSRAWDACKARPKIEPGSDVVLGVDTGVKHDSTAAVLVSLRDGKVDAEFTVWQPDDEADEVLDLGLVEDYIRHVGRDYHLIECVYDPYHFGRSAQMLEEEGLPMVEYPQDSTRMAPASQTLYDLIQNRRLRHGGDRVAREHALSAVAKETERGWRLSKIASKRKIDAMVALAMAVDRLTHTDHAGPAVIVA